MLKAFQVLLPAKRFAVKNTYTFKQTVPVKKPAIEDRDDSLAFGHELAVEENDHEKIRNSKSEVRSKFEVRNTKCNMLSEGLAESACQRTEVKAAEDSRTPRPRGRSGTLSIATASWSAAVLCRFHFADSCALL